MFERIRKGLHSVSLVLVLLLNPDSHATWYYAGEGCFLYKLILCAGDCPCASFVPPLDIFIFLDSLFPLSCHMIMHDLHVCMI